jgi:hypothetical protein
MSFLDNLFATQSSGGGGLSDTSASDIAESKGFLATLASAVTAARVAVDLAATPTANLATLASAIATGNMKVLLQAGTAVIGKLASNVGVNIGIVDVSTVLQLPSTLGQKTKATSLGVTIASDQPSLTVADGGTPLMVIGNGGNPLPVSGIVTVGNSVAVTLGTSLPAGNMNIGDVDVASLPPLPAGTNSIGKLGANAGINIGQVDLATVPTANLASIAADIATVKAELPSTIGQKLKTTSLGVALASDQVVPVSSAQLPATLGPLSMMESLSVAVANEVQTTIAGTASTYLQTISGAVASGSMKAALQAGTNNIGDVDIASLPALPSVGFGFQTTVGTTEVTLASNTVSVGAVLKADDDNVDSVWFRYATGTTTTNGFRLKPGQQVACPVSNTNLIRCISGTASQKVHCSGA